MRSDSVHIPGARKLQIPCSIPYVVRNSVVVVAFEILTHTEREEPAWAAFQAGEAIQFVLSFI
jgi:hypothetical protein